jgi:hypothetical protein
MSRFTDWLLNLPERRADSRARKRKREVQDAYAKRSSDGNLFSQRRHGESDRVITNYKGPPGR